MTERRKAERQANLVLIGLRASGKTTLGRAVARAEGRAFVDTDELVLEAAGAARVSDVFRERGEAVFRALEREVLRRALEVGGRVLALGGGTPTAPGASALIEGARREGRAVVVYLHAPAAVLASRLRAIGGDENRPALRGSGDAAAEVAEVYAERDPLYRRLADRVLDESPMGAGGVTALSGWSGWGQAASA